MNLIIAILTFIIGYTIIHNYQKYKTEQLELTEYLLYCQQRYLASVEIQIALAHDNDDERLTLRQKAIEVIKDAIPTARLLKNSKIEAALSEKLTEQKQYVEIFNIIKDIETQDNQNNKKISKLIGRKR